MRLQVRTRTRDRSGVGFWHSGHIGMRAAPGPGLCAVEGYREPKPVLNTKHRERLSRLHRD